MARCVVGGLAVGIPGTYLHPDNFPGLPFFFGPNPAPPDYCIQAGEVDFPTSRPPVFRNPAAQLAIFGDGESVTVELQPEAAPDQALYVINHEQHTVTVPRTLDPAYLCLLNHLQLIYHLILHRRKQGAFFHGCGFAYRGQGYLCPAPSETGKSTLAARLSQHPGFTVFNDERLIAGADGQLYSTPWGGNFPVIKNGRAPLRRIFFLEQGPAFSIRPLPATDAFNRALICQILPYGFREQMEWATSFTAGLLQTARPARLILPDTEEVPWLLKEYLIQNP
jgi:hypothetical protein